MNLSSVLVVSRKPPQRQTLQRWLESAGYQVLVASDFAEARHALEVYRPTLLVTDVKLNAYNGLHLAILNRGLSEGSHTLLIGDADAVLQKEADREQATYLTPPLDEQVFLAEVRRWLHAPEPRRRMPRKAAHLDATVDGVVASIVDVSYGGLRLVLQDADGVTLPRFFTLRLPAYDVSCRVRRVWTERPAGAREVLLCGAALPSPDAASAAGWRALVDAIPVAPVGWQLPRASHAGTG